LPIVAVGVIEIDAFAIRVIVRNSRVLITRCSEPLTHGFNVLDFVSEVIDARQTGVWRPALPRLGVGFSQSDITVIRPDMHPASITGLSVIEAYSEFGKCGLQEAERGIDVSHNEIRVFKPN